MQASEPSTKSSALVTGLAFLELALIGVAIYFLSKLVGTPDTSNDLIKLLAPTTSVLVLVVVFHTFLWYMYSNKNPLSMNLYYLIATSASILISLTALSIAIVNKS